MRIYLMQHGLALPQNVDPESGLSEKGVVQTQKIGEFFTRNGFEVDVIWHSSKLRCAQTAQILARQLTEAEIIERPDLNPLDPVDKFVKQFSQESRNLLIVGHLPFLQKLAGRLLTKSNHADFICFRHSGLICLEHEQEWKISWMVIPDLYL